MSNLKLVIEVIKANNLLPKDGLGSSNTYVELYFDNQNFRTTIKEKDLNPVWKENFHFNIYDPSNLQYLTLEAYVYHNVQATNSRCFLGKVSLIGTSFAPFSDAIVPNDYPLEKRGIFARVRGTLSLKFYTIKDQSLTPTVAHVMKFGVDETNCESNPPELVSLHSTASSQPVGHVLDEIHPSLDGERVVEDGTSSISDLLGEMQFLFVRVVKAHELPTIDGSHYINPYVEVKIGHYKGITETEHLETKQSPEWDQMFVFSRDQMQEYILEVMLKDADSEDDFVGIVRFNISQIPFRVPPDSPLAPQWYKLEDKMGGKIKGELMLAIWIGIQADEVFSHAAKPIDSRLATFTTVRSKVYIAPQLWYVRVTVGKAEGVTSKKNHCPDLYVRAQIGNQVLRTKTVRVQSLNAIWNEDLLFVAAEPFESDLQIAVEEHVRPSTDRIIWKAIIPLGTLERRIEDRTIHSEWFNIEKPIGADVDQCKKDKISGRIHLGICLDGGYKVFDESTQYSTDLRPTAKRLWTPSIGVLRLRILGATGLLPMKTRDGRGTSDSYCVAKYGHIWLRTSTVVGNLNPEYNEQYDWEVFDLATVLTIGVFDNCQLGEKTTESQKDLKLGKVCLRLSTLETGRIYTRSYPLLLLHPSGVKKMGELHLAIQFSCTSFVRMLYKYSLPQLPKMHYVKPLTVMQQDMLRHQAINIVAGRLGQAAPPLKKEVVEYMTEVDSHFWSLRRSKANFFRLMSVVSGIVALKNWFRDIYMWKNPITTAIVHVLYLMLVCFPGWIPAVVFFYIFLIGVWNFRYRPRFTRHMDTRMSQAESVHPDELDEEFDTFPTSRSSDIVRMRYDRLRSIGSRIQLVVGEVATYGERILALISWPDPRATGIFITFCLVVALALCLIPFQVVAALGWIYVMRHPIFRDKSPSVPINFIRRMPDRTDVIL